MVPICQEWNTKHVTDFETQKWHNPWRIWAFDSNWMFYLRCTTLVFLVFDLENDTKTICLFFKHVSKAYVAPNRYAIIYLFCHET